MVIQLLKYVGYIPGVISVKFRENQTINKDNTTISSCRKLIFQNLCSVPTPLHFLIHDRQINEHVDVFGYKVSRCISGLQKIAFCKSVSITNLVS